MALEDLQRKLEFAADSFAFLLEKLKYIKTQAAGNSGKAVTLSDYLDKDDTTFLAAAKAVGLAQSDADTQASQLLGKPVLTKDTLDSWTNQIEYSKSSLTLLKNLIKDATPAQQAAVKTELDSLVLSTNDLNPQSGQARTYQTITSLARVYTNLAKIQYERSYDKLTSGLGNIISNNSTVVEAWRTQGINIDPLRRIDFLQTKLSELLGGINLNKGDSVFAKNWQIWKEKALSSITPEAINKSAQEIYTTLKKVDPTVTLEQARTAAVEMANYRIEADEIPKLKGSLLNNSQYQRLANRYSARSNAQQFGRFLGSGGSLLFSVPGEVFAAVNTDDTAKHSIKAALFAASALQVPYAIAFTMIEARIKKQSPTKVFNDLLVSFQKNAEKVTITLPEKVNQVFGKAESVKLETLDVIDEKKLKLIKSAGDEAKFTFNRGKELGKQLGKSIAFFAADLLSFANDIYTAASTPPTTDLGKAQLSLSLLTDTAFFGADLLSAIASGTKALRAAQGLAVVGAALSSVNSILNIVDVAQRYQGNFSSEQSKWDLSNAVIGAAASIAGIGVSIVCPPAALLFMLIPNFSAIGQAVELQKTYSDFTSKGLNHEAQVVDTLHKIAALDATPIVNWFSGIYTPDLKNKMLRAMNSEWYQAAFEDRMNFIGRESATNLASFAVKAGTQSYHLITSSKQDFNYLGREKSVSDWVDIAVRVGGQTSIRTSQKTNGNLASTGLLQLDGILNEQAGTTGFDTVYQIDQGDGKNVPNLTLDNRRSTLNALYINSNAPNAHIKAGSGNDMFVLSEMLAELDGGLGNNNVSFQLATKGVAIDMARGNNIAAWKGSSFADTVRGTAGNDMYAANGGADNIQLQDGDDFAAVNAGVTVDMGNGDDVTFIDELPTMANGGAGNDVAVFQNLKTGLNYATTGIAEGALGVIGSQPTANSGHTLKLYESLIGSQHADNLVLLNGDAMRSFSLGAGNDQFTLGSVSDVSLFMGDGNDTLWSDAEAYKTTWDNGVFFGGKGNDSFNLIMNNSNVLVNGGEDNDQIMVYGHSGSNKAEIIGGEGDDEINLRGDVEAMIRFGTQEGTDNIYDDARRTKGMVLVVDGASQSDLQVSYRPYTGTRRPPLASSDSDAYAWTVEIKVGKTTALVHTLAAIPADITVVTPKDKGARMLDLLSAEALASLTASDAGAPSSTSPQPQSSISQLTNMLVHSMASFGAEKSAISSISTRPQHLSPLIMAVAPI
ncbi:calcium-binding protein [Chitinivorax sp. B]|uniref:calcium-binding protein n=1 Tax=Chitinivorax sp. B TaxID=2502235 RepID=UPI0010F9FDD1|nr:calcium-binding protein [Chitinivorax sp. B]